MKFTVERLIKYLETFPKDSKVCFVTKTEKRKFFQMNLKAVVIKN